jgi:hypothetical protein
LNHQSRELHGNHCRNKHNMCIAAYGMCKHMLSAHDVSFLASSRRPAKLEQHVLTPADVLRMKIKRS